MSTYDISHVDAFEKMQLPETFLGNVYNLSYKWLAVIPEPTIPISILDIGVYHGANVCSYMKTYAKDPKSTIHCVDPWLNYDGYNEYRVEQTMNYSIFLQNISKLSAADIQKIYIYRGLSEKIVPTFKDEYFDIIYIDGNHEQQYVLEDAIMSYKKIKSGGWIIFDDMHDSGVKDGVRRFLEVYASYFEEELKLQNSQLFIKRK
jgi:hypothetical protein